MPIYREAKPADWPAIETLLNAASLPLAGASAQLPHFLVCDVQGEIAGCVGAEVYGSTALLRSLAVMRALNARGIGTRLVELQIARLEAQCVREVALLTTTAEAFFARAGFVAVPREALPEALGASEELRGACPAGAVAMLRRL
jgi:N-acetylglutamate synthase-like GNAT family acetyltransferase